MYLRKCNRRKDGKTHSYWALVESYRTERGPRQRIVSWLGELDESGRLGIKQAAEGRGEYQRELFNAAEPEWVEVNVNEVRVGRAVDFGGPWLGKQLISLLGLDKLFEKYTERGREEIAWTSLMELLILSRFCEPSSELHIAEHFFEHTALGDILGIPQSKVNDDRLYRALDRLLPHKDELEKHLKERIGSLFNVTYDLFLYDVTSTYFEGNAQGIPLAQHGYSRDHRKDRKQVCIGLVVTRCGFPLGYELFAGNRSDSTTVDEIVAKMETKYGKAERVWVMDRGMANEHNFDILRSEGRKYIVGAKRAELKRYTKELLSDDWKKVRAGVEAKVVDTPDGKETFILCRSADRKQRDDAIFEQFVSRIDSGLQEILESCKKRNYSVNVIERRIGRLLQKNSRAAAIFEIQVTQNDGKTVIQWLKKPNHLDWHTLSSGCYILRSNIRDWSEEELWKAYVQLTEAESAFRIHKSDLSIRPIWHRKEDRVSAHILVCFLAFVLWKTLAALCKKAGLGDEPRKVLYELSQIKLVEVILPTRKNINLKLRCVSTPTEHQKILLQKLNLKTPKRLQKNSLVVTTF